MKCKTKIAAFILPVAALASIGLIATATIALAIVLNGTNLDDILIGTPFADTISGKDGADRIEGNAGDDNLHGNDAEHRSAPGDEVTQS